MTKMHKLAKIIGKTEPAKKHSNVNFNAKVCIFHGKTEQPKQVPKTG